MHHFFVMPQHINKADQEIKIVGEDVRHIQKSLRLKEGNKITISDGLGSGFVTRITDSGKEEVRVEIIETIKSVENKDKTLTLFQGLAKGSKMELIIQKAVELGVNTIVPIMTEYSVVQLKEQDKHKKKERWQKIAEEAAKQCRRLIMPVVHTPIDFNDAIAEWEEENSKQLHLLAYENETDTSVKKIFSRMNVIECDHIGIWIGPEGGFHEREVTQAQSAGVISVGMGPRILRTETAGIAMLSFVLYEREL
ncbi:16S rRNA (uracil(1498)-N(3))-methyltransferase [Tindallia californiensis]|uniref:Ribosomal RNA small subunit methyltransferase E n=1 Tax=Tindallia californiensis TaxID=159292 RepID=A0A1H3IT68_9FIRM|nr:16S rRNA (uracil(1498)-N(3))-methyltransferase [Tindallia californiensis]SDY30946.1 16S rRNA (uracil1498-N3)-methyltransferase [Tindallia californiensis]